MNWKKIMSRFFKNLHNSSSAFGRIFVSIVALLKKKKKKKKKKNFRRRRRILEEEEEEEEDYSLLLFRRESPFQNHQRERERERI